MKKTLTLISLAALVVTGCTSGITRIGSIGNYDYYKAHGHDIDGPNFSVLFVQEHDCPESVPVPVTAVGGPGIGSAIIGAGGTVGAATVFGGAIRPATTSTTVNGGGASASNSNSNTATAATGGTTSTTVNNNHSNHNTVATPLMAPRFIR